MKATLEVYADADWGGEMESRSSTSCNLYLLRKNAIQLSTKKQSCIARSSSENNYVSAANASLEIKGLINILNELNLQQKCPISVYEDNQSTIKMIQLEKLSSKSQHIDILFHLLKQLKQEGTIDRTV